MTAPKNIDRIAILRELGFTYHKDANDDHVVAGHGRTYTHSGLSCIMMRIRSRLALQAVELPSDQNLREAFGMFLTGLAYYTEMPENADDAKYLSKQATYHFLRARNHVPDLMETICAGAAKDVYRQEVQPEIDNILNKLGTKEDVSCQS